MKTARNAMTGRPETTRASATILEVAKRLAIEDIGAIPVCTQDNQLEGILTDRDIVVKVVAKGLDPSTVTVGEIETERPVTVSPDESLENAMRIMADYRIRRLPVVEGRTLVGVVSQADLARELPPDKAGKMVAEISK